MTYNIEGLARVYDPEIRTYINDFDFCLLVETFSSQFPGHLFPNHIAYVVPGVKLSDGVTARLSGGLTLLVRKCFVNLVERITVEHNNIVVLKLSKELFDTNLPVMLLGAYLLPSNSEFYRMADISNGIAILEQCIMDLMDNFGNVQFLLIGDLNARTGGENAKEEVDDVDVELFEDDDDDDNLVCRTSKDKTQNEFGKLLLNLCTSFDLYILNGAIEGNINFGNYTYVSTSGCSVIDYAIISRALLRNCQSLNVRPRVESKHMPVEFTISSEVNIAMHQDTTPNIFTIEKLVWDPEKEVEFKGKLTSNEFKDHLNKATALVNVDINDAIRVQ